MEEFNFNSDEEYFLWDSLETLYQIFETYNKWEDLNVIDFDWTLYSRKKQLVIEWFKNNRWNDWNVWLLAYYTWIIDKEYSDSVTNEIRNKVEELSKEELKNAYRLFAEDYYKKEGLIDNLDEFFKDIAWNIKIKTNLILTAGDKSLQEEKLISTWLSYVPYKVVEKYWQKVKTILFHVLELWYIPKKITVYEDKPELFYRYWQIISNILWTELIINKIKINDNNIWEIVESQYFNFNRIDRNNPTK